MQMLERIMMYCQLLTFGLVEDAAEMVITKAMER